VGALGGKIGYCIFYLVVHVLKLHSISLVWGVTTEAMEYEEMTELREGRQRDHTSSDPSPALPTREPIGTATRLSRLGFVGFGGTLGQLLGGVMASLTSKLFRISGLLLWSAIFLELSAQLSVELGRIMQRHWEDQQRVNSCADLASCLATLDDPDPTNGLSKKDKKDTTPLAGGDVVGDPCLIKRVGSQSSMKRVGSGNSLAALQRANSSSNLAKRVKASQNDKWPPLEQTRPPAPPPEPEVLDDSTFALRLVRGINTILHSRLLLTIFTYNALYASTNVLLSFQRAELVAERNRVVGAAAAAAGTVATGHFGQTEMDTAFLARINIASSVVVFLLQASGAGAAAAARFGPRGTLAIMPVVRTAGVLVLGWWHVAGAGRAPNLILFLGMDEFCRVINLAVAKPVRENLWRGMSNEARYEAKPIVDTLANRWGGGSVAFLVKFVDRILALLGMGGEQGTTAHRSIFGFPPELVLCLIISTWWTAVSLHLGHIRQSIDKELKKD